MLISQKTAAAAELAKDAAGEFDELSKSPSCCCCCHWTLSTYKWHMVWHFYFHFQNFIDIIWRWRCK